MKTGVVYEAGRSGKEAFAPLRLIERSIAFSSRYATRIIAMPTSQRSMGVLAGLVSTVSVEELFIMDDGPYPNRGSNVHH